MSTQSGITASKELLSSFNSINGEPMIIRVSEDSTSLIPDSSFKGSTGISDVFESLSSYLLETHPQPAYLVIPTEAGDLAFASYIPDEAPIRSKMLYASTKNTLVSQLGANFKKSHQFAWSEIEEVSMKNFLRSFEVSEKPLTEEEKLLDQINSLQSFSIAEASAKSSSPAYKKQLVSMHDSSGLLFKVQEDLDDYFQKAGQSSVHSLITFAIDLASERVKLTSSKQTSTATLISTLEESTTPLDPHPQYALYHYSPHKFAFLYSCPLGSKVKERMIYASNKKPLVTYINSILQQSESSAAIDKNLEVGDLDELEISELDDHEQELTTTTRGLRFNKPKGPRRR